jgi:hypothetical protein
MTEVKYDPRPWDARPKPWAAWLIALCIAAIVALVEFLRWRDGR